MASDNQMTDHDRIREVLYTYCRGIDRRRMDLVRECYHPDATDHHGDYRGGVDGAIEHFEQELSRWDSTSHFIGNVLIDIDGHRARVESYALAHHRRDTTADRRGIDFVAGVRYVDDFERRSNLWRIATRVVVVDWTRTDELPERGWIRPTHYAQPSNGPNDPVFEPDLRSL